MNVAEALLQILHEARAVGAADFGNIQVYNAELGGLQIVAHHGFDADFLQTFELVRLNNPTICARAFRMEKRVFIPDVLLDPFFSPYRATAQQVGFRSVQSTPILGKHRRPIGVLSTHFATPVQLSRVHFLAIGKCAAHAGRLIQIFWE